MDCAFCQNPSVAERSVARNEHAFAFPTNSPIVPGHMLVCPRRHLQYYEELSLEEKAAVEELRVSLKGALMSAFGAKGFNYAWNEERIGGQSVPHFHLHIVPRTEGDAGIHGYEPRSFLYRPGARPESPEAELLAVRDLLKSHLG